MAYNIGYRVVICVQLPCSNQRAISVLDIKAVAGDMFDVGDDDLEKFGSMCALPSKAIIPDPTAAEYTIYDGYCLCDPTSPTSSSWYSWCTPPSTFPSQINLSPINVSAVVVNFVLADEGKSAGDASAVPICEIKETDDDTDTITYTGFSTSYSDSTSSRTLSYHNVILPNLSPRTSYTYRVSVPGHSNSSEWTQFKSLYSTGPTNVAMYADMGLFGELDSTNVINLPRHNMGNVLSDLSNNEIDFIVHSGDHAYEFEVAGGQRGDGYMDAYSDVLTKAPWLPGWGNHEYLEMDRGNRLANITGGLIEGMRQSNEMVNRMQYSIDIGLIHIVQLDMSPYWCNFDGCETVDSCGFPDMWTSKSGTDEESYDFESYRNGLIEFLKEDLEGVDRTKTPWVVVSTHFPFYDYSGDAVKDERSLEPDLGATGKHVPKSTADELVPSKNLAIADIEPLLKEHGVDIYFCGHAHNYQSTWPMYNNTIVQENFLNPQAPIHVLSGAAGVPEWEELAETKPEWGREGFAVASYSRVKMPNATHLFFEQVGNDDGKILDEWVIVKE
ncbi:hypothetical protein TL16_g11065 [Triparma laevis f. inornata]|uniref:Purple acid phosphatase n=1 Tax=Triparma laevis f. inornata TaxID=1714386 RepID=A0A9W7BCX1_9STRA|nr:hypothetical protein TL16_g11065 [Triparma laevis f. inornata]